MTEGGERHASGCRHISKGSFFDLGSKMSVHPSTKPSESKMQAILAFSAQDIPRIGFSCLQNPRRYRPVRNSNCIKRPSSNPIQTTLLSGGPPTAIAEISAVVPNSSNFGQNASARPVTSLHRANLCSDNSTSTVNACWPDKTHTMDRISWPPKSSSWSTASFPLFRSHQRFNFPEPSAVTTLRDQEQNDIHRTASPACIFC
mmetsp:Transcript_13506/g.27611  ORF Transcript_13506/g.27611 Transcript_13506/m.27611 type:complete len:202 (+) Transcript_13506:164-769(+)